MLDGRFDPAFFQSLAEGQVSASDLPRDYPKVSIHPVVFGVWLASLLAVALLCVVQIA